jgi:XTP/dITP diphosphohydrolase
MKILFASTNFGKFIEVKQTLESILDLELVSVRDLQQEQHAKQIVAPDVEENGSTYFENARLKAQAFYSSFGMPSLADDSGLEVEALDGAPGLYSARYAGVGCSFDDNIQKLLKTMKHQANRKARFCCCLYLALNADDFITTSAEIPGQIAYKPIAAKAGFGYDPILIPDGYQDRSLAQIKELDPKFPTHRVKATRELAKKLAVNLNLTTRLV